MRRILKSDLDKFYTKVDLAKRLIEKVDIDKYDLVIDPCCGDGSFYNNILNNKIGIDISPDIDDVIKSDYLLWDYSKFLKSTFDLNVLVISNPPFGKQGSLAMKFVKRSCEFANTVAFILPISFSKPSIKNRIPKYFHLIYEEILPSNSFLLDSYDYDVKCVFQVWERRLYERDYIDPIKAYGFSYTKNPTLSDMSVRRVGVYAGKAFLETNKSKQSHYFLIIDNKEMINDIVSTLNNTVWEDLTVGPRSISKSELNLIINSIIN